jgi:hypothetical protein
MPTKNGYYDPDLQMFTEQIREPDLAHLNFLRWLAARCQLEHELVRSTLELERPRADTPSAPSAAVLGTECT